MSSIHRRARLDSHVRFKVSRAKLARVKALLDQPVELKQSIAMDPKCSSHMLRQHCFPQNELYKSKQQMWQELFQDAVTQHDWDTFIRALRLASQNHAYCGLDVLIRNTCFGILTHPMYREPTTLRLFLYAIAPCRNERDINIAIQSILRAFNGDYDLPRHAGKDGKKKMKEAYGEPSAQVERKEENQNNRDLE